MTTMPVLWTAATPHKAVSINRSRLARLARPTQTAQTTTSATEEKLARTEVVKQVHP